MFRDSKKSDASLPDQHLAALTPALRESGIENSAGAPIQSPVDGRKSLERLSQTIRIRLSFRKPGAEILCMSIPEIALNQTVVHVLLFLQDSDGRHARRARFDVRLTRTYWQPKASAPRVTTKVSLITSSS
jgi:hypothetical protein